MTPAIRLELRIRQTETGQSLEWAYRMIDSQRIGIVVACAACLWASSAEANIVMEWTATANASVTDPTQVVTEIGGFPIFAFQNIDSGTGTGISTTGSSTVSGPIDFLLGDLEQIDFVGGSPGGPPTVQTYGEGDGNQNFIQFYDGDLLLASGEYLEMVVTTNYDTGFATGVGRVQLLTPGEDSAFFNEVMELTSGTGIMQFEVDGFALTFDPELPPGQAVGEFTSNGRFIVTPEPSGIWLMLVASLLASASVLRRWHVAVE